MYGAFSKISCLMKGYLSNQDNGDVEKKYTFSLTMSKKKEPP